MGGEFGEEWIHIIICMTESLSYASETITTLLVDYTPIQNKKIFFKKKKEKPEKT